MRASAMSAPASVLVAGLALAAGCGRAAEEVELVFPDEGARAATRSVGFTAFVPIAVDPDAPAPRFVGCGEVGPFSPVHEVDPALLGTLPNLGEVLQQRQLEDYPLDGDWSVEFRRVTPDPDVNPWGAVMVLVEARGDARAAPGEGGGRVSATLLTGCYCVRTAEGSHPDARLDQAVKKACPALGAPETGGVRTVELAPVVPREFRLEACGVDQLTAPRAQLVSPGPEVCLRTVRCDDAPGTAECFRCSQPCAELRDLSGAPVIFEVEQPGGATTPLSQVVVTGADGRAQAQITVDDCRAPITVRASVVGRDVAPVTFEVACVAPVPGFRCGEEVDLIDESEGEVREPTAMTILPGEPGEPDHVALLAFDGQNASVEVFNPMRPASVARLDFPGEAARAIHGYHATVGARPGEGSDPVLAVVTSAEGRLRIRIYRWARSRLSLEPAGEPLGPGDDAVLDSTCARWNCGSLSDCSGGAPCGAGEQCLEGRCVRINTGSSGLACNLDAHPLPVGCGCRARVEFQTDVAVADGDLDGDGTADLAVATNMDLPLSIFYSASSTGEGLYDAAGCSCGTFGQAASAFAFADLGGPGEAAVPSNKDLVIGAPGGAFVKYGVELADGPVLACGQSNRFGELVPVRDVVRGRFACDPERGQAGCAPYDDVVVVSAKALGGGTFDDPGTIRVVFGGPHDLSTAAGGARLVGVESELRALTFPGRAAPKDPRSAEVADFNGDGFDDLAVLFGASSEEVHVWLGGANRGLGELAGGIVLENCAASLDPGSRCTPLETFATPDLDADGRAEVVVVCDPSGASARLRWYSPEP